MNRRPFIAFWAANITVLAILLIFVLASWNAANVSSFAEKYAPPCPFRKLTGLLCPGCGTTRASLCLLRQDVGSALRYNPLLIVAAVFLLLEFAWVWARWMRPVVHPSWRMVQWRAVSARALLFIVLGYWAMRNLPPLRQWLGA